MITDPKYYNLPIRIQLENLGQNKLGIRRVVKSRIIRKDAKKIVSIAQQIISVTPEVEITLICNANICSKSLMLLAEAGVFVQYV